MKKKKLTLDRRQFLKASALAGAGLFIPGRWNIGQASAASIDCHILGARRILPQIPGGTLAPGDVNKFVLPLVKPPAMPLSKGSNKNKDKYKIAVRQFQQRILSPPHPVTTVWSYGSINYPGSAARPSMPATAAGAASRKISAV